MTLALFVVFVVELLHASRVNSSMEVKIHLIKYSNPSSQAHSGSCCDLLWSCSADLCDPYFKVCFTSYPMNRKCNVGNWTTEFVDNTRTIIFGDTIGEVHNPIVVRGVIAEKGAHIEILSYDTDARSKFASSDDFLGKWMYARKVLSNGLNLKLTRKDGQTTLTWKLSTKCMAGYFGSKCVIYCQAQLGVHNYTCDGSGRKICFQGWVGSSCSKWDPCFKNSCQNKATCENGNAGYKCACSPLFTGSMCEVQLTISTTLATTSTTLATTSTPLVTTSTTLATTSTKQTPRQTYPDATTTTQAYIITSPPTGLGSTEALTTQYNDSSTQTTGPISAEKVTTQSNDDTGIHEKKRVPSSNYLRKNTKKSQTGVIVGVVVCLLFLFAAVTTVILVKYYVLTKVFPAEMKKSFVGNLYDDSIDTKIISAAPLGTHLCDSHPYKRVKTVFDTSQIGRPDGGIGNWREGDSIFDIDVQQPTDVSVQEVGFQQDSGIDLRDTLETERGPAEDDAREDEVTSGKADNSEDIDDDLDDKLAGDRDDAACAAQLKPACEVE